MSFLRQSASAEFSPIRARVKTVHDQFDRLRRHMHPHRESEEYATWKTGMRDAVSELQAVKNSLGKREAEESTLSMLAKRDPKMLHRAFADSLCLFLDESVVQRIPWDGAATRRAIRDKTAQEDVSTFALVFADEKDEFLGYVRLQKSPGGPWVFPDFYFRDPRFAKDISEICKEDIDIGKPSKSLVHQGSRGKILIDGYCALTHCEPSQSKLVEDISAQEMSLFKFVQSVYYLYAESTSENIFDLFRASQANDAKLAGKD